VAATLSTSVLIPRIGPKTVVPLGMALGAVGLIWQTRLGLDSTYAADVLPAVVVTGLGIGLVMAPGMSLATSGVAAEDAGVASASVNTMQQVGGSIGTALLNTLAAGAATSYLSGRDATSKIVQAHAALESYSTAYWWSAAFFAAGALITIVLYRRGTPTPTAADAPAVHM
jgi:MFS family permease